CDTTEHRRLHRARLVDGVVVANTTLHDGRIRELSAAGVPFVAFGRTADRTTYPWVDVDNRIGMRLALEHLASAGHRRVGYLGPPADTYYSNERIKELRKYGRKGVIEPTVQLVAQADEEPTTTR